MDILAVLISCIFFSVVHLPTFYLFMCVFSAEYYLKYGRTFHLGDADRSILLSPLAGGDSLVLNPAELDAPGIAGWPPTMASPASLCNYRISPSCISPFPLLFYVWKQNGEYSSCRTAQEVGGHSRGAELAACKHLFCFYSAGTELQPQVLPQGLVVTWANNPPSSSCRSHTSSLLFFSPVIPNTAHGFSPQLGP